jgi:RNA polymerase sigma factor (sigma-70 family)
MRDGDEQALAVLFRRHYALLYDYGVKLSGQEELTKDSIQEVFAYVWEKRESLSEVDSVRSYLLVSLRHHLLKTLQKQRQRQNAHHEYGMEQEEGKFSFEDLLELQEKEDATKQALKSALDKIPTRLREALYLKTYDGLTYQEIGKIMNINSQVARNYVCEAFQRLRNILNQK